MTLTQPQLNRLLSAMAEAIFAHADELTKLDQAIGDGDHGVNMRRGFEAAMAEIDRLTAKPLPEVLTGLGTTLVMKVGGASGPLYGTLFLQLGKHLPADPGLPDLLAACDAAVAAVAARGRAEAGCKTLLDVLLPVAAAAHAGAAAPQALLERLPEVAEQAAAATVPLRALRGRAAFLGERSIGHMDPGARSAALLIAAACRALKADA